MEAFAPLPIDLFADSNTLLEDDPNTYFSLSQFDLELQQQAQAALLQPENWQDFDKYLPLEFNDTQAQPIFTQQQQHQQQQPIFNFNDASTIFYEPLSDLIPRQQQQHQQPPPPPPQQPQLQQPQTQQTSPLESLQSQEDIVVDNISKDTIKQEYASPESMPYSPPQNLQSNMSTDIAENIKITSKQTTSPIDFMNWNSPLSSTPIDATQAKVPIQRLKSNTIIANAVNATLNNNSSSTTTPTGRQHKKTAHNAIERRYRNNINDRIAELKNAVPALLYAKVKDNRTGKRAHRDDDDDEGEDGEEFLDGVAVATKLNKATILRKATEYINHLKKTGDDVRRENETLQHILTQLPGGSDILQRYHMQKQQREKELHQQQVKERESLKIREQQRKAANRKRAKHNNHNDHSDEYESSSSSPGSMDHPVTPPTMTNRVFMAVFMAITFFSTSPLTSGPSSSEQFENHHHATKSNMNNNNNNSPENVITSPESFLGSLFKFDDIWLTLRTIIFMICIAQLFLPWIRYLLFGSSSLKVKRVNKSKRAISISPRKEFSNSVATPGEIKTRHMCNILEKSMRFEDDDALPEGTVSLVFSLIKETVRIFSHHFLGYDIMYGDNDPEEEWARVCKWIKLNETRCVGGDPTASRLSMLYSCFRMINLVDTLDQDPARAYATAALQLSLIIPYRPLADRLSEYFWLHAVRHQIEDEDEGGQWLQSLSWIDADQEYGVLDMRDTQAWAETMDIMKNETHLAVAHSQLGLSYSAPVVVPVSILSNLHLLDSLCNQYDRLVSTIASDNKRYESTAFVDIMMLTNNDDQQQLAYWLAAVGAMVESIWKNDIEQAKSYIPTLIQRVPRSMTSKSGSQKSTVHQLDEMVKKSMIHILIGAVLLGDNDMEKQKQGLTELENAQVLRTTIRKNKGRQASMDLESGVMALAEFVVSFVSLESWISAMRLDVSTEKKVLIDEEVREVTLHLRRMIRDLSAVSDHQSIVERLSRLGRFIAHHPGDTDSACDLSDREEDEDDDDNTSLDDSKADKAQSILRGLA